jgi:hypothetical protein
MIAIVEPRAWRGKRRWRWLDVAAAPDNRQRSAYRSVPAADGLHVSGPRRFERFAIARSGCAAITTAR